MGQVQVESLVCHSQGSADVVSLIDVAENTTVGESYVVMAGSDNELFIEPTGWFLQTGNEYAIVANGTNYRSRDWHDTHFPAGGNHIIVLSSCLGDDTLVPCHVAYHSSWNNFSDIKTVAIEFSPAGNY